MGGAFGQIVGTIDSWLGRSFLLARFFPWLLFAAANLAMAAVEVPGVRKWLLTFYRSEDTAARALDVAIILSGIAAVAYTLSPATQAVTRLLEGQGLPRWIAEPLLVFRALGRERLSERGQRLFQRRASLPRPPAVRTRLAAARAGGVALAEITDRAAIEAAAKSVDELRAIQLLNRPIEAGRLALAVELVCFALSRNCAELVLLAPQTPAADFARAEQLQGLYVFVKDVIAPYAATVAEGQESHVFEAQQSLYGQAELAPTRLGNDVAALRSYCLTRYRFDFDFLWPRLQLALTDAKLVDGLRSARIQVDFSILCLTLTGLFVIGWLVALALAGHSLWSLLAVAGVGPPLIGVWLWMVHESYAAYAEVARGTVDLARFDLLKALRRPLPETLDQEGEVWEAVVRRLQLDEAGYDGRLVHPT